MSDERIDIELNDKISPAVEKKLLGIANAARVAHTAITQLSTASAGLKAAGSLQADAAKAAKAMNALEAQTNKAAIAAQRLVAAQNNAAASAARATTSTTQSAVAAQRLVAAQNNAAASAARAALAHNRLAQSHVRARTGAASLLAQLRSLHVALVTVYASAKTLGVAFHMADEYVSMENRLRSLGLANDNLAKSFLNLQQIANRSRTSLKSTIELYTRTSLATKNLGYTAEQVNQFTETMNKAVMTSGATAQEANNALIQLSQGLSSGRLQGEELRSVLEQLPVVADIIARSMGVSRGELRKLGADGKITSQVIMEAFLKTTKRVDLMFEQTAMTVGQSWTILKNNLQTSIGEGSKSAMAELAKLLNDAASAVKDLTDSDGFSLLSGTLTALVKTMRTLFVLFESLGTVVLPIVASQIGRTVVRVAEIFANSLFPLIRIAQKIMPSSMGSGADALMNSVSGYFSKWRSGYDEWEDAAVKKSLTLNDRLAEIYAYKHPEAGYKPPEAGYKPPENQPTKKQTGESETAIRIRVIEGPALTREDPYGESVASLEELFSALKMTDKELEVHSQLMEFKKVLPSTEAYSYRLSTLVDQLKELDSVQSRQSALTAVDVARRAALVDQINALTYTINEMNKANERDLAIRKESLVFLQKENEAKGRRAKIQEDIRGQSTFGFRQTLSDLESVPGSKQGKSDFLVRQNTDLFEGTENAYDAQYREYERMVIKLDTLKEKEWISDESYSKARLNLWAKQNKAQLDGVGETFGNLAKLQESSSRRMAMIGKAAAQFQVAFNGVRAISEAWASGPFPANVPAITAATTAFAIQEAQLNNLAGFAYGGGFTVGGTGGIDSQTVAFRATPGEQVSITTPEQRKESAATAEYHYHDYAGSETKAERESKFAQFQRMAAATANDRSSARKQMELV